MDFKDQIKQLAERATRLKDSIQTEEALRKRINNVFSQCFRV